MPESLIQSHLSRFCSHLLQWFLLDREPSFPMLDYNTALPVYFYGREQPLLYIAEKSLYALNSLIDLIMSLLGRNYTSGSFYLPWTSQFNKYQLNKYQYKIIYSTVVGNQTDRPIQAEFRQEGWEIRTSAWGREGCAEVFWKGWNTICVVWSKRNKGLLWMPKASCWESAPCK